MPFFLNEDVSKILEPKHQSITFFFDENGEKCAITNCTEAQVNTFEKISSVLGCLSSYECNPELVIQEKYHNDLQEKVSKIESPFIDFNDEDIATVFSYHNYLTNKFKVQSINIYKCSKQKRFEVEVNFSGALKNRVRFSFLNDENEFVLIDAKGLNTLFTKVDSLLLYDYNLR